MSRTAFYSFYLLVAAGMAYMNDLSCTYGWVMSACPTYEWVTSHERTSHVPRRNQSYQHINESCHVQFLIPLLAGGCCAGIYEWFISHLWMSHVTHMNESCHTYEWVMSHIWMSHVTHMNDSFPTYGWVMTNIWISHVARKNESCPVQEWVISTYEWVMSRTAFYSFYLPVAAGLTLAGVTGAKELEQVCMHNIYTYI